MAVQTNPEQTISELVRKTQELETKVADLLARIETLETWYATGVSGTHYLSDTDGDPCDDSVVFTNGLLTNNT